MLSACIIDKLWLPVTPASHSMYLSNEKICGMNLDLACAFNRQIRFPEFTEVINLLYFFKQRKYLLVYCSKLVWPLKECCFVLFHSLFTKLDYMCSFVITRFREYQRNAFFSVTAWYFYFKTVTS